MHRFRPALGNLRGLYRIIGVGRWMASQSILELQLDGTALAQVSHRSRSVVLNDRIVANKGTDHRLGQPVFAILGHGFGPFEFGNLIEQGLWVGMATATFVWAAVCFGGVYNWLAWSPLQFVGRVSYSLYLVHIPVIFVMMAIQRRLTMGTETGAVVFVLATYGISLLLAWLMYCVVERPSMRLAKWVKTREWVRRARKRLLGGLFTAENHYNQPRYHPSRVEETNRCSTSCEIGTPMRIRDALK